MLRYPSQVACTLPATGEATIDRAQITDVAVTETADADVVTFTFAEGIPAYTVETASPPFIADPSGMEITVNGSAFVAIVMHGASRVDPNGVETYTGPDELAPGYTVVEHLVQGGDFEAVATWYVGLAGEVCPVVTATASEISLTFAH